jgi:adenylate cyclase
VVSKEIERKFLVKGNFKEHAISSMVIKQGFLSTVPERTVRVRIKGDKAFITIKGIGNASGISRFEWEKEIPKKEATELLKICEPGLIEKKRYIIPVENDLFFEVDVFYRDNHGLMIAEIELPEEDTAFSKPSWLGKEVTGDIKYYNSYLAQNPYNVWIKK